MSELVTSGLIGGHLPTQGFYSGGGAFLEAMLSALEARAGTCPSLRIRFDLDGDGIYEVVEWGDKIISVGNVSRAIEYDTGKGRFGSCSFTLRNDDQRWTDNWSKSYTYFNPSAPTRYHHRPVLIELGFDTFGRHKDENWFPVFKGFIQEKRENAGDLSVEFSLIDEWTLLLSEKLGKQKRGDEIYNYVSASAEDARAFTCGHYCGDQIFLSRESKKDNSQLMIPMAFNIHQAVTALHGNADAYKFFRPCALNQVVVLHVAFQWDATQELYFWSWNTSITAERQWLKLPELNNDTSVNWIRDQSGSIIFQKNLSDTINFKDVNGVDKNMTLAQYFDDTNKDYRPLLATSVRASQNWDNPAVILYHHLTQSLGIPADQVDASSTLFSDWVDNDLDYDNPNYFSFDTSYSFLKNASVRVCVRGTPQKSSIDLVNALCEVTRAGFFIDKGKGIASGLPTRRIHFTIHQPRRIPEDPKVLTTERLRTPQLSRSMLEVSNRISVLNFPYRISDGPGDFNQQVLEDSSSMAVYGVRDLTLGGKPTDIVFLYDSDEYAYFLASFFLVLYREPPIKLSLITDLIGYTWDIKSLISIKEKISLNLGDGLSGIFEVYGFKFDTRRWEISLDLQWAGYLIMPFGDTAKRYSFCDSAYADSDSDGLEYYCW